MKTIASKLTPLRRAYLLGLRRGKPQARRELIAMAEELY